MLVIDSLRRAYPARSGSGVVTALNGISLTVGQGEFFALLGPSGCGKTTLLQSIAGLETPNAGAISIGGKTVFDAAAQVLVPANKRDIGMVFQSYAIWPHMTVFENVAFPLRQAHGQGLTPQAIHQRVMDVLALVKLADFADRPAPHLSGGQQQRVALARAVVYQPRLLLLDEPLSNLDAKLRDTMRVELRQLVKSLGITAVFVTHDQAEAMGMADRIALMRAGELIGLGSPEDIYFRPDDVFAAEFMGQSNLLAGRIAAPGGCRLADTPMGPIRAPMAQDLAEGTAVHVVLRPHAFELGRGTDGVNTFTGTVLSESLLGSYRELDLRIADTTVRAHVNSYVSARVGETVDLHIPAERCIVIPVTGRTGAGTSPAAG